MSHILVVDDDLSILGVMKRVLEKSEFSVDTVTNGQDALTHITAKRPDLVILDIIMPHMDGLEVCRRIRTDPYLSKIPILFLTAKDRPADIAEALDAGGDDYISKPFEVVEFMARVRALLRRMPGGVLDPFAEYHAVGKLKLHVTQMELVVDGNVFQLTAVEHQLMHYLMLNAGQPIPAVQLLQNVWHYPPGTGDPILVRVHIGNIRSKIEPDPEHPRYLINVRGRGYMLTG